MPPQWKASICAYILFRSDVACVVCERDSFSCPRVTFDCEGGGVPKYGGIFLLVSGNEEVDGS